MPVKYAAAPYHASFHWLSPDTPLTRPERKFNFILTLKVECKKHFAGSTPQHALILVLSVFFVQGKLCIWASLLIKPCASYNSQVYFTHTYTRTHTFQTL